MANVRFRDVALPERSQSLGCLQWWRGRRRRERQTVRLRRMRSLPYRPGWCWRPVRWGRAGTTLAPAEPPEYLLLGSHGRKGQNILKEFDDHHDEARYVGDCDANCYNFIFISKAFRNILILSMSHFIEQFCTIRRIGQQGRSAAFLFVSITKKAANLKFCPIPYIS